MVAFDVLRYFVVAHDGFTLADLCSYEGAGNAQNEILTWPFGKSDGGNGDYNGLDFILNKGFCATTHHRAEHELKKIKSLLTTEEFDKLKNSEKTKIVTK